MTRRVPLREWLSAAGALALVAALSACATAGSTFRSGVGEAFPEHPPYYAGAPVAEVRGRAERTGYLPIVFQRGATRPSVFDVRDGPDTPIGALLVEMNAYLDTLAREHRLGVRLAEGGRVSAVAHRETIAPPDVMFGCLTESALPDSGCAARGDSALGRGRQMMRLAVGRPSAAWIAWTGDLHLATGMERTLVVTLEVGAYLPRQRGLVGKKEVELGTGHVVALPWLTSLETPVTVLQLTGAVVDGDGRAVRIGAEGILARRTRLLVSAVGGEELLSERDVQDARAAQRDDLAGSPVAWRVALGSLVEGLAGRR